MNAPERGRRVVVTGGSGGIGSIIAGRFLATGLGYSEAAKARLARASG